LVGLPLFLWFSTRLFGGLRAALNEVFDTDEIRSWPVAKLVDLTMVFATGAVLVANALVAAYEARNAGVVSGSFALDWFWRFSMETVAFALGILLFFLIFKILPSRRIQWQTALVAAVFCSLGFEVAKRLHALFFPSGTQANQTGIALQTRPGTELILEANAHLVHYELAGVAALSGAQIRPVATPDGLLTGELVRAALRPASPHVPRATAVA